MRFGGEMDDGVGLHLGHQIVDQLRVANVAVNEAIAGIFGDRKKIFQIPGVGELIQIHDLGGACGHPYKGAADESGAARDKKFSHLCCVSQSYWMEGSL